MANSKEYMKAWYLTQREARKAEYLANREQILEKRRLYYLANRQRILAKAKSPEGQARGRANSMKRRSSPHGCVLNRLRCRLRKALKTFRTSKSKCTKELVGCSIEELCLHLEKQFSAGMSWAKLTSGKI